MKKIALVMLPILALSACNSSKVPTKPTGKETDKDGFMAEANKAKRTGEDEIVKQIKITGSYYIEIYNTSYPEDATKCTLSGSVTYNNMPTSEEDQIVEKNIKAKGDYPVIDPFSNAYLKWDGIPEDYAKNRFEGRFGGNKMINFGIYFAYMLANIQDPYMQQMIETSLLNNVKYYTNPLELLFEYDDGKNTSYELDRFNKDGVISTSFIEYTFKDAVVRDEERNKHQFDAKIRSSQSIELITEKR